LQTFPILKLNMLADFAANTSRILNHSFKIVSCTAALALISLSLPASVKAEPPGSTVGWKSHLRTPLLTALILRSGIKRFGGEMETLMMVQLVTTHLKRFCF
jgi:hypothetical protein